MRATAVEVPFVDLRSQHAGLRDDLIADLEELLESGAFANGSHVGAFEEAFARAVGAAEAVGVASGLDALRLSLEAAGIGPGAEVIVPAHTFAATYEAVVQAGAHPVPVDVTEDDYGLDCAAAAAAVGPRTQALLPVHLYGQMADMVELRRLAARHELLLLEDACQAHGAVRDGWRAGAAGDAAAFSFYPAKNLGALGDAGALTTGHPELAVTVRALREHGQRAKYVHERVGWTSRLDTFQAAVLLRKLPLLPAWNAQRAEAAAFYLDKLPGTGDLRLPQIAPGSEPVWHLFVVRTADPDGLAEHLRAHGIATGRHYPEAVPHSEAFRRLGHRRGEFPVAEALAAEALSLPLYPGIADEQLEAVVAAVEDWFRG